MSERTIWSEKDSVWGPRVCMGTSGLDFMWWTPADAQTIGAALLEAAGDLLSGAEPMRHDPECEDRRSTDLHDGVLYCSSCGAVVDKT